MFPWQRAGAGQNTLELTHRQLLPVAPCQLGDDKVLEADVPMCNILPVRRFSSSGTALQSHCIMSIMFNFI